MFVVCFLFVVRNPNTVHLKKSIAWLSWRKENIDWGENNKNGIIGFLFISLLYPLVSRSRDLRSVSIFK